MRADAHADKRLLYVSDYATNGVFVYDYPSGTQVGMLTGMDAPFGQCVDAKGDVYVANSGNGIIDEFQHGGTSPIATYDSKGFPAGCSVDAAGDLAVTNSTTRVGGGNIMVWLGGKGRPQSYHDEKMCYYLEAASYDAQGNLIAQGVYTPNQGFTTICGVLKGAKRMTVIPFNAGIQYMGATTWDGKYLALDEEGSRSEILQAELQKGKLVEKGTTTLYGNCDEQYVDVYAPFIVGDKNTPANDRQGTTVIGGNSICKNAFDFWRYPSGGGPRAELNSAPAEPYGESVSIAP
jgi:hypothetical protein